MTEEFTISLNYKGQERDFAAKLLLEGYSHKFEVTIDEAKVFFEPDDSGSYRAIKLDWQDEKELMKIDRKLLGEISAKIASILA